MCQFERPPWRTGYSTVRIIRYNMVVNQEYYLLVSTHIFFVSHPTTITLNAYLLANQVKISLDAHDRSI